MIKNKILCIKITFKVYLKFLNKILFYKIFLENYC